MTKEQKPIEAWQMDDAKRLDALYQRFKKRTKVSQSEFGAQYGIGTQGMVSQYLTGRRPLNIKSAEAFARGMGVRIDEFSPTLAEQIAGASETITQPPAVGVWPFKLIDEDKVARLDVAAMARLEAALLIVATQIKVDIEKDDS